LGSTFFLSSLLAPAAAAAASALLVVVVVVVVVVDGMKGSHQQVGSWCKYLAVVTSDASAICVEGRDLGKHNKR